MILQLIIDLIVQSYRHTAKEGRTIQYDKTISNCEIVLYKNNLAKYTIIYL